MNTILNNAGKIYSIGAVSTFCFVVENNVDINEKEDGSHITGVTAGALYLGMVWPIYSSFKIIENYTKWRINRKKRKN